MANFPGSLDTGSTLPNPGSGDLVASVNHALLHDNENGAIIALEGKLGIGASTPTTGTVLRATGTGTTAWADANLTTDVTGTLPVANGGTGVTTSTGGGSNVLSNGPVLGGPTLNSPVINNGGALTLPTITDTLVGRTTTDTLTNKSINGSTNTLTNIPASALSASAITLGYVQITANFLTTSTTPVQVTGLTIAVTIPAGGRKIEISVFSTSISNTSNVVSIISLWDGVVGTGTQLQQSNVVTTNFAYLSAIVTPAAGSKTYNIGFATSSAGTSTFTGGTNFPAYLMVRAI